MKGYLGLENAPQDSSPLVDYIDFNLTPTDIMQEGRLMWDSTDGTLQIGMPGGNVNLQIGQEQLLRVSNKTGADIPNGYVVYVNGAQGQKPTVALADADTEATSDTVIGITTELITNNNNGYVCINGLVRDLNTNAFNNGDVLYLSQTAGQFTNTAPTPPAHAIILGNVIHKDASQGVVLVNIQIGQELEDLHNVLINTPTDGNVLEYSSGLWINGSSKLTATRGNWKVFYSNGSGVFTELALGASGTVLQSNGASSAPSFATPTAGGGVGLETVLMLGGM